MVLGKAYKEDPRLVMFLYFFLVIAFSAAIVFTAIYMNKLAVKIALIVVMGILIILLSYVPYNLYKVKKTNDNIIIYNELDETLTINVYKKTYKVNISDIATITLHNIGTKMLFANRIEDGKLTFYLSDGTIIKTPDIANVYDSYDKLNEIVFKDREFTEDVKDQLIDKLDGWGSKKEYPTIVSILVAIFIPFFGAFFVPNQKKYKELKNGKTTGLMAMALVISTLWVIAIIVVLAIL